MWAVVGLQNLEYFDPFGGGGVGEVHSAKRCKMILLVEKMPLKQLLFLVCTNPVNGITWIVVNQTLRPCTSGLWDLDFC